MFGSAARGELSICRTGSPGPPHSAQTSRISAAAAASTPATTSAVRMSACQPAHLASVTFGIVKLLLASPPSTTAATWQM